MSASGTVSNSPPKLKDYILTERLGTGTYATVYKAYKKDGCRDVVAVKCIRKTGLNRLSTENLLTEIELLKTLQHENIVQLKDFQWDNDYIYLIMEYCGGGDLSQFIHMRRALPETSVKRFLQQIASALQYMRSKNVSHMDLKPQNILLTSQSQPVVKLADFGFAHYLVGEVDAVNLRGSPLYMAPEIITQRYYNEKADLWSVGVILFECLFGRAPFASKSIDELQSKITDSKPIEIPYGINLSGSCRQLLRALLQRDPYQRISCDDFFTHDFVDLEHRPCAEAFPKAISLVTLAVESDSRDELSRAIDLYSQALDYFIPAVFYEQDPRKKATLRQKVREYMQRAEVLKDSLKPQPASMTTAQATGDQHSELSRLIAERPMLVTAVTAGCRAERKEAAEEYEEALRSYEAAIETLLVASQEESKGKLKELLQIQVSTWLARAEAVKSYLKVKDFSSKSDLSQTDSPTQDQGQCLLQ